jgi:TetR/AcrR family transcriptional regulator, regulator of autoinduction and epiphytic fitness
VNGSGPRPDGRSARRDRTRAAVVEAVIALVREGELKPTGAKIAARAGVSPRALWLGFADLDAVWDATARELLVRQEQRCDPIPPELPRAERVRRYCARRAAAHEAIAPFGRASRRGEPYSAVLVRSRRRFVERVAAEVEDVFAPELALAGPARSGLVDTLTACSSWAWWSVLRDDRDLDAERAEQVLATTVASLLDGVLSDPPGATPS